MDDIEEKITFAVLNQSNENRTETIELYEYDTVELLKILIHSIFEIPPHEQIIEGWTKPPEDDQTILQLCSNTSRINYLCLRELDKMEVVVDDIDSLEIEAAQSCFRQICTDIATLHINFNTVSLNQAIAKALLVPIEEQKALLLYLHNSKGQFASQFLRSINNENISEILTNSFFFVGWDVQNTNYHDALCKALTDADMPHLCNFVETKTCAAIIMQNVLEEIKVIVIEGTNEGDFLKCLNNTRDFLTASRQQSIEDNKDEEVEMDSKAFQKLMADRLGDRDYTCYAYNQHEHLKNNIGFAVFGPPQSETGYDNKQKKKMENIYKSITKKNEIFAEYKDQVELSIIFNVTEPLASEKESRKKKNPNYNPNTDIIPVPLFVLRKCRGSDDPDNHCRIFVDDLGRVYENWTQYIENNKLDKCIMVLPKNGRYKVEEEKVLLENHNSPACDILKTILRVGDIASTAGSLGAGGVMLAGATATVTTVAVAPVALITAGVVGAGAGIYALGRSIGHLVDRVKHEETLSVANSEARGIYFNLLAGSMGFVGAGANVAVSQLAAQGVNIGKGVGVAVNTLGVANIGVSGASIVNSSYDVLDQWLNEKQTPSLLTIVQLSSSILFFGNAVYNFKTCQTIVDEAQTKVLQDYTDSLRSNRHRKTFNKMMKETIRRNDGNQANGRAEVIKTIKNIQNKDEVFAVLTRTNKAMNEKGVKYFASEGQITLNGHTINMNEFVMMNKQEASAFLSNLPLKTDVSPLETASMIRSFSLDNWSITNVQGFAEYALRLIGTFGTNVQGMILQIVQDLLMIVIETCGSFLGEIFPHGSMENKVLLMVMEYFGGKAAEFLRNYEKWRKTGSHCYYDRDFSDIPEDKSEKYVWIFAKLVKTCFDRGQLKQHELLDIKKFVEKYIIREIYEYQRRREENQERDEHSPERPQKVKCSICSGYYFQSRSKS